MNVSAATTLYAVDFTDCHSLAAMRAPDVVTAFTSALQRAGAHVVTTASHSFPDAGMTVVLILAESHAVLHTWPETGTVHIDIFSCSTRLKSLEAIADLSRLLGAAHVSTRELPRCDGRQRAASPVSG